MSRGPRRLRLLHVLWRGDIGGAERAVFQLVLHQRRAARYDVVLAFGQAGGFYADSARGASIPVIDLGLRSGRDLTSLPRAVRALRAFDIHHFHAPELTLMAASALLTGAHRIYTHRGGVIPYRGRRALRYRALAPLVRRRFAVTGTDQAALAVERLFGVPAGSVSRTFNGVDFDLLRPEASRTVVRAEAGLDANAVLIGTAAHLRPLKRIDWLIDAAARMSSGAWQIVVIGDGDDRPRLERLAAASAVRERIRFVGMQERIGDWLHALDVFVLPTGPEESFGNAVVEAMACGLPAVVAADSPAHRAHIEDGRTGFVVRDRGELAARLDDLVRDVDVRRRLGAAARERARASYSIDRMLDAFDRVYEDVLASS